MESHWAAGNGKNHVGAVGKNSSNDNNCWLREDIETVQPCHPCTGKRTLEGHFGH